MQRVIKKIRSQKSNIKLMHITIFCTKGAIHTEFASEGTAVNNEKYAVKLRVARITRVKPCLKQWRLMHDNAFVYTAMMINAGAFLPKTSVAALTHTL
jgi:hypothetical protein